MVESKRKNLGANIARPLAFTLLMLYGLLTFLVGYKDWQERQQFAPWADWILIVFGVLLGSAAIRVLLRRRPAFGLSLFALLVLFFLALVVGLAPAESGIWKYHVGRAAVSAGILWLVWRSDRALG